MEKQTHQTLGANVTPSHYDLLFEPDFKKFTFQGTAYIVVSIREPTKTIKLHAKEIQIKTAELRQRNLSLSAKTNYNSQKEELTLTFPQKVHGTAQLHIQFSGTHNDGMYGFYRSSYQHNRKTEYLLTSQFEAANARAAFPCFDEPAFKATFDVTFIVDRNLFTLSNMPIKKEKSLPDNKKRVSFLTSPRMSTYLLYLGVGHFKFIQTKHRHILIRVLTTPEKIHLAHLALDYTKKFLAFFEKYFQVNYPLPKVDIIAIPDFAAGAMENWGAITFREIALLGNEKTSVAVKQNIAITVAHELAHQWFGNLVTMQWWDDLWLNESFATFMSYKAVNAAFPEWDLPLQYFEDTIADALSADEIEATHPINVHVNTPGEIDEIFDNISYDKGGSVLHMLEDAVGETAFRKGLTLYLKKHAYKNATKHDLWTAIQEAKKENFVSTMVHGWITQSGYPLVSVTKENNKYHLSQQRFSLLGKQHSESWIIPLRYTTDQGKAGTTILREKTTSFPSSTRWIKVNYGQPGFYRVRYDSSLLAQLGASLRRQKISSLDAAGIENDLFSLMISRQYSLSEYLSFIEQYCLDAEYPLNSSISGHLGWLLRLAAGSDLEPAVRKTSLLFHLQQLKKIGWQRAKHERNTTTLLRSMVISNLGLAGHAETLKKGKELFRQIQRGHDSIDPNLRSTIYLLAARQGDEKMFSYFVKQYQKETLPEESRRLLRAIGMFRQKSLTEKALAFSLSAVRLQDSYIIPFMVSLNPGTNTLLWSWTKKHWPSFMKKFTSGTHMLGSFVRTMSSCSGEKIEEDIAHFFSLKKNMRDDVKLVVKQVLEHLEINRRFMEKNLK
ncbi:M1 family metallopeptidase [Candidatus Woesearchaeota archaeon]|nr:M1 family metallopeptidase [Candidatus Woesearchaeota archaeon]